MQHQKYNISSRSDDHHAETEEPRRTQNFRIHFLLILTSNPSIPLLLVSFHLLKVSANKPLKSYGQFSWLFWQGCLLALSPLPCGFRKEQQRCSVWDRGTHVLAASLWAQLFICLKAWPFQSPNKWKQKQHGNWHQTATTLSALPSSRNSLRQLALNQGFWFWPRSAYSVARGTLHE